MSAWFDSLRQLQDPVVLEAQAELQAAFKRDLFLRSACASVDVEVRSKELYAVHRRREEMGGLAALESFREVAQLRIVANLHPATGGQAAGPSGNSVCYHILGLIHAMWKPIPGRVKDYIASPKPNGYQSLHTHVLPFGSQVRGESPGGWGRAGAAARSSARARVRAVPEHAAGSDRIGPNLQDLFPLELQIRTGAMHRMAECGIAADPAIMASWHSSCHLAAGAASASASGAAAAAGLSREDIARRVGWLNSIREWQQEFVGEVSAREFVDAVTGDLLVSGKRVFVWTPKGEVMNLARGATVVDYAYHVHTDVGNSMVAAKVNGVIVPPSHVLRNAEVVEIVSYGGAPSPKTVRLHAQWAPFCATRSARHKLLKFLRDHGAAPAPPPEGAGVAAAEAETYYPGLAWGEPEGGIGDGDGLEPLPSGPRSGRISFAPEDGTEWEEPSPDQRSLALAEAAMAAEPAVESASCSVLKLRVECGDRTGLLADVSGILARHGMSIRTYSGKPLDVGRGTCSMGFELSGDHRQVPGLCRALSGVPTVLRWQIYCTLDTLGARGGPAAARPAAEGEA